MRRSLLSLFVFLAAVCPTHLSATPFIFNANLIQGFGGGINGSGTAEVDLSSDFSTINVFLQMNLFSGVVASGTGIYDSSGNELYNLTVPFGFSSGLATGTFAFNPQDVDNLFGGNLYFDVLVTSLEGYQTPSGAAPMFSTNVTFPGGQGAGGQLVQVTGTPEPASEGLFAMGAAGIGLLELMRRRASKRKDSPSV